MKFIVCLMLLVTFTLPSGAAVFECVDEAGRTIFRGAQCKAGEQLEQKIDTVALDRTAGASVHPASAIGTLGKNLLKNASFENRLVDWSALPGAAWSSNKGVGGSGALMIQAKIPAGDNNVHEILAEQCVPLGPGEKFQLTARFKAGKSVAGENADKARVSNRASVIWYASNDCTSGGQFGWYVEPEHVSGWQVLRSGSMKPALQARAAKITLVQKSRSAGTTQVYWDDISFHASEVFEQPASDMSLAVSAYTLPPQQNYVINGGFKSNLDSWQGRRAEWSSQGDQSVGSARITITPIHGEMGAGALNQCVNIGENITFDFGASVRKDPASTQNGGGRIRVSWYDGEDCGGDSTVDSHAADVKDVLGWQSLQINELIAPPGSRSVLLELIQTTQGSGSFSMFWDDVYFKAVVRD